MGGAGPVFRPQISNPGPPAGPVRGESSGHGGIRTQLVRREETTPQRLHSLLVSHCLSPKEPLAEQGGGGRRLCGPRTS